MDKSSKQTVATPSNVRVRMPQYEPGDEDRESPNDLNAWFTSKFPQAMKLFGPGFLVATYDDAMGLQRTIPLDLNEDAWAYALKGDPRLMHDMVYYEGSFWFYDPAQEAWRPTTEAKLQALLSNYLVRSSQEVGSLVEISPLITKFRKAEVLERIIARAKALLAADRGFFEGEQGHRRLIDGKIIEPTDQPSYMLFVQKALVREDRARLTLEAAFSAYFTVCQQQQLALLTRHEFKALAAELIRTKFNLGIRNDVVGSTGKQTSGWIGLRLQEPLAIGQN